MKKKQKNKNLFPLFSFGILINIYIVNTLSIVYDLSKIFNETLINARIYDVIFIAIKKPVLLLYTNLINQKNPWLLN